ncbi:hypothetical protein V6N11_049941 [Hibiscus sabdariffa]|uniref:HECT-type E3 ubiquitin transferase n=1 Tax=Hibiscus sabdariffa TaxID=183260 RepID=A0ABR2T984_9ROSI
MQIDILENGWDAENEILMPLDARNLNDFSILLETCRLLRNCDQNSMNIIGFFAAIPTSLLDALPPIKPINRECFMGGQIDMIITDVENLALDNELVQQIAHFDSSLLLQFTNVLLSKNSIVCWLHFEESDATEVPIIAIACAFLHVTFNRFYKKSVLLVWVYGTELVSILGNVIKRCHHNHKWLFLLEWFSYLLGDAPVWLLSISIFCPLYKHKFRIVDNEEFYEQEKPSYLKNLKYLTFILRQASQQLLRMNSSVHHSFGNWVPTTLLAFYLHLILEDKDSFEWEGIVMTRSSWAKDQH